MILHVICTKRTNKEHALTFKSKISRRLRFIPLHLLFDSCSFTFQSQTEASIITLGCKGWKRISNESAFHVLRDQTVCSWGELWISAFQSRLMCCHTLYPSLLCCSRQAWLWSACCCCWVIHWKLLLLCWYACLSLRVDSVVFHSRAVEILSSASWVGREVRERAGSWTLERALFHLKGDRHV